MVQELILRLPHRLGRLWVFFAQSKVTSLDTCVGPQISQGTWTVVLRKYHLTLSCFLPDSVAQPRAKWVAWESPLTAAASARSNQSHVPWVLPSIESALPMRTLFSNPAATAPSRPPRIPPVALPASASPWLIYPPLRWPEPSFPGSKTLWFRTVPGNSPHYQAAWGSSGLISHCPIISSAHWATSHSPGLLVLSHLLLDRSSSSFPPGSLTVLPG